MSAADYGKLIYDLYLRRELVDASQSTIQDVGDFDLDRTALDHIETAERSFMNWQHLDKALKLLCTLEML